MLTGLAIIDEIASFRERLSRESGLDLNVRVGIHTGLVVVGYVGSAGANEYTAMGDAVNLAACLYGTDRPTGNGLGFIGDAPLRGPVV